MNEDEFKKELQKLNINITNDKMDKLNKYYYLILEWNKKINLTAITDKKEVYLKHFYDSLTLIKGIDLNQTLKICDVGTGAGIPGIVLKIVFDNLNITLLDALEKRCKFLQLVINELNLKNIEVIHTRAEDYFQTNKEKYDLIVSRAVAKLNIISELCIPGLKINSYFIAMKSNVEEEIKNRKFLDLLDSKIEKIIEFKLPIEESKRTLVVIKKLKTTDKKYPRKYDKIIKMPL